MKFCHFVICLLFLSACSSSDQAPQTNGGANDYHEVVFSRVLSPDFEIKATYDEGSPAWLYKLQIFSKGELVYSADSTKEFEFNDSKLWPAIIPLDSGKTQVLLEVNDRPFANYILSLWFKEGKLIKEEQFPLFKYAPRDFDDDGILEYAGFLYTVEGYTNDSSYYNPIFYCEYSRVGICLDTTLMNKVNRNLFGINAVAAIDAVVRKVPEDTLVYYLNSGTAH